MNLPTVINLELPSRYERQAYGVLFVGRCVHRIKGAKHNRRAQFRLTVWDNTTRLNPHPGERKWNSSGPIGGDGKYLDPSNQGTDAKISVTAAAEGVVIALGPLPHKAEGVELSIGEVVVLRKPDGHLLGPYVIDQKALHDPHFAPVTVSTGYVRHDHTFDELANGLTS